MLRCGKPFKVRLRYKLNVVDKTAAISGINVKHGNKQECADKTTTHS